MAISQPISTDPLNVPDHSLMHRIIASDPAAAVKSIGVNSDNTISILAGIAFPAVQVANAGVNVLDDYEEGTWTPVLSFGGASVDITYSAQTGQYTKIGRMVFFSIQITLTSKGSSVGQAAVTLPFTAAAVHQVTASIFSVVDLTYVAQIIGNITASQASVSFYEYNAGDFATVTNADCSNTTAFRMSGFYFV